MAGETDAEQINWKLPLVIGPIGLVVGFLVLFWAVRSLKALMFLLRYQVKPKPPKAAKPAASA